MGNLRIESRPADDWPAWTDEDRWVTTGPDDRDAEWWSQQNEGWDEEGPADDDPIWDRWAEESSAQDRLDRGLCPF